MFSKINNLKMCKERKKLLGAYLFVNVDCCNIVGHPITQNKKE